MIYNYLTNIYIFTLQFMWILFKIICINMWGVYYVFLNMFFSFFKHIVMALPFTVGSGSITIGSSLFDESDEPIETLVGSTAIGSGISTTMSSLSPENLKQADIAYTQVYVESMNEKELDELIRKLEDISIEENPKVLKKSYNERFKSW